MDAVLFGAAVAAFVVAAVSYFHGRFAFAAVAGVAVWALCGRVLTATVAPGWAWTLLGAFALFPAAFLLLHVADARLGFSRLPTIYSIPLAFLFGLVLLLCTGAGVLLA